MALFELDAGTSRKFYRIEREGTRVDLHWGRFGSAGRRKTIECATEADAQREYEEHVRVRRLHGYARVVDESKPRDAELERARANEAKLTKSAPLTGNARFHFLSSKKRRTAWLEVRGAVLVRGDDDDAPIETRFATEREATRARDAATAKLVAEGFVLDAFGKK